MDLLSALIMLEAYLPKAKDANAIGAENPTKEDTQPEENPIEGWYIFDR